MFRSAPAEPATLPSRFGRRYVVCVDTEEEFDWTAPKRREATSVTAIRSLPIAQARMRACGVRPAYLMDYPVAADRASADIIGGFLAAGECTIGSQLHPWVNPPFDEPMAVRNSFPGNLPRALERAKMLALTDRIEESFGQRPVVYRAGRYGIGPNTAALLDELGYRVDCSVRPLFSYAHEEGPVFWDAPTAPHWLGADRRVLELPLTSVFVGGLARMGAPLFRAGEQLPPLRAALARSRLLNRVALTPEGMPLSETLEGLRLLMDHDVRFFSIAFHSPSVEPGHTPFVRDQSDLSRLYAWLDGVFDFLAGAGVEPSTPEEVYEALTGEDPLAAPRVAALTPEAAGAPGL